MFMDRGRPQPLEHHAHGRRPSMKGFAFPSTAASKCCRRGSRASCQCNPPPLKACHRVPYRATMTSIQRRPWRIVSLHMSQHSHHLTGANRLSDTWSQKPCEDTLEIHAFDNEMNIGQAYTTDEAIPILDLQRPCPPNDENPNFEGALNHRRMSGSSFAMSTSGGLSDMPSYEDFAAAFSEVPSFGPASTRTSMLSSSSEFPLQSNRTSMLSTCSDYPAPSNRNSMISSTSDYPAPSNRNSLLSSTQLSPVASPRMTPQSRSDVVRTQSRGRASPSPRPGMRAAPYSIEGPRNKRWSTGTYGTGPNNRRPSPFIYHQPHDVFGQHNRIPTSHSSPIGPQNQVPLNYTNLQAIQQHPPYLMSNVPASFQRNSMFLPTQLPAQHGIFPPQPPPFDPPPTLLSNGHIHMLHSNGDPFSLHGHYANLSDPPDIYASSRGEPVDPPPEDMNPDDPDLVPHEQELRNEGDLYTPKWVRGHGSKREGWCGLCKPGRWLVLKNSAFWYDKSFTHGISAATGVQFQEPQEQRRMDGNPDIWEGLCGTCSEWIPLVSSKKKGTTWFRHSYKVSASRNKRSGKEHADQSHFWTVPYTSQDQGRPKKAEGERSSNDRHSKA